MEENKSNVWPNEGQKYQIFESLLRWNEKLNQDILD